MRKDIYMELQLEKKLCLTLGPCPSRNSCKYTWFLPTGLKKITIKDKTDLKLAKSKCDLIIIKYAA